MSKIALEGNSLGSGTFTIAAPNSNSNPTLTLPTSSGTVVVTGGAQTIEFAAGSAASPSITFTGDTNTGIFSPAADTIAFAEGGAEIARFDSSGNFMVGTTSPTTFSGFKTFEYVNSGGNAIQLVTGTGVIAQTISSNSNSLVYMGARSNHGLVFTTNDTEAMRITSGGNVGIGTTSPGSKLQVTTATQGESIIFNNTNSTVGSNSFGYEIQELGTARVRLRYRRDGTGIAELYNINNASLVFGTNDTERARITSGGNFGIGQTSPGVRLHVTGGGLGLVGTTHYYNCVGGSSNAGENILLGYFTGTGVGGMIAGDAVGGTVNNLTFCGYNSASWNELMRLRGDGNFLIGYTTSNGAYKLQVNSQIFATNATIATSDGRYKEDIESLTNSLDIVCNLNPVQFKWKKHPIHNFDTETVAVGFIAQEVQEVLSDKPYTNSIVKSNECVLQEEQKDADGNVTTPEIKEQFYGLSDSSLIPILTKAIQELKAITDAQATRIEALEAEVAALKGQ